MALDSGCITVKPGLRADQDHRFANPGANTGMQAAASPGVHHSMCLQSSLDGAKQPRLCGDGGIGLMVQITLCTACATNFPHDLRHITLLFPTFISPSGKRR